MAVSALNSATTSTSGASTKTTGVNSMDGAAFLNLMIKQLQQQDPLNPTDSNQLLTQISQISTLQSNTAMSDNLKSLTLQQSIGAAGNLIGKNVQGKDEQGGDLKGIVTSVRVENRKVYLEMDSGKTIPMENLTNVAAASGADAAIAAALPGLQKNLQNIASTSGLSASALVNYLPQIQQYLAANGGNSAALSQVAAALGS
jgi:flagellar basal-body rod modification protein FlgD